MAQYLLTQEDIDRFSLTDAVPGDMATEQELRLMFPAQMNELDQQARQEMTGGMFTPSGVSGVEVPVASQQATPILDTSNFLPPDTPVAQQTTGTTAPLSNTGVEALLAQPAPAALTQEQDDPYGNLTKTQKRMLAFAAISDAGMALQGKQGTQVRSLLGDFTKRADMARKAKAAQQRSELLGGLMGGGTVMSGDVNARRQQIMNALTSGLIDGPTARIMLDQLGVQEQKISGAAQSASLMADVDLLLGLGGLDQLLGVEGIFTRGLESLNLGALRPEAQTARAVLDKIKGGVFLSAFESLKGGGQITELEGKKAEQAQARLLETQSPEAFRDALAELRFYLDIGQRRSMGEAIPPNQVYQSKLGETKAPASTDDLTAEEKKRLGLN